MGASTLRSVQHEQWCPLPATRLHLSWRVTRKRSSSGDSADSSFFSTSRLATVGHTWVGGCKHSQKVVQVGWSAAAAAVSLSLLGHLASQHVHLQYTPEPCQRPPPPRLPAPVPQLASASSCSLGTCLKKRRCSCCTRS